MNPLVQQTKVDLGGIYPIGLLREFFPRPPEFTQVPNFYQSAVYGPWFAARIVQQVWAWGNPQRAGRPQYDAVGGASYFNLGWYGGGFDLSGWLQVSQRQCNCYDLAGIVQLGRCLLMDGNGNELFDSRWVFQNPNGFINQCVLYGWDVMYPFPPGVNNPFFLNQSKYSASSTRLTSYD
jgi:hypothetical protein